jgi:hypothetical protein
VATTRTVVQYDEGGILDKHVDRWRQIAAQGGSIDILGLCQSACTMVTVYFPKDRLCFGERAYLNFHQARSGSASGPVTTEVTKWMIDKYPDDIRGWIVAKGGLEKMPSQGYWTLPAKELWEMGYRKCGS